MAIYFGLDLGTSFIKGAVIDTATREMRHTARIPFPPFLNNRPPLYREVDPAAILSSVEEMLAGLGRENPRCDGLVLCGQMHGFVLVNEHGDPVSNYISWLDRRISGEEFAGMKGLLDSEASAETGNEFRPGIAGAVLGWMSRHSVLPEQAMPVSAADFVAARLCHAEPVMDPTQAAAFGTLRLSSLDWHDGVVSALGLDRLQWPVVLPFGSRMGTWRGARCYAPVGDQQCALAGALLREEELSINIGTGSQVARIVPAVPAGILQTRPYFNNRYLRTITHIPAGRALSALVGLLTELGQLAEQDAWPKIEAAVSRVPSTSLRAQLTYFPGPCGYGGSFENLTEENLSIGHVFRAAFESMADNYRDCAQRLRAGSDPECIVFSGGIARRNELLRELTSASLGLPYRLSPQPEDTLFGLLVLAVAAGEFGGDVRAASESFRRLGS